MNRIDHDELATVLKGLANAKKKIGLSAKEERIIAGFADIQHFVAEKGDVPHSGEERSVFERIYAARLDRLRQLEDSRALLVSLDTGNLLGRDEECDDSSSLHDPDRLAGELESFDEASDLTELRYVRQASERRAPEKIANRTLCRDFDKFKPMFNKIQADLSKGIRKTVIYGRQETGTEHNPSISKGDWFILEGQVVYVAEVGKTIRAPDGSSDARLRAIYSNGTESDILKCSLKRALYRDETGRRITEPSAGSLFGSSREDDDTESGVIYVLRSKSEHPDIASHRTVLHKIGVTGSKIKKRIANAKVDPTFLLAEVEIIAEYKLSNINRMKLEKLIHRFFSAARLVLSITDRFGNPIEPREWFLVPLPVIDSVIQKIQDGTISDFEYDPKSAELKRRAL
ncbi:MAG: GIY-YIG nuclease family protein [Alphaproteobacteria bacterium]|nr:GIY-YIG nuclease family protein [Alphaproteobacteria bacterium]